VEREPGDFAPRPLGAASARTLYNLADALHPELVRDLVPEAERCLRQRGLGAIRRFRLQLAALDWEPLLGGRVRRRFWRLPRAERQAACARWRESRFAARRRAWAELAALVEDALAALVEDALAASPHSSDGA
jgi:hypothetical protein